MTHTERKTRIYFETEFRGDIAALIAAAEGGDPKAILTNMVGPVLEEKYTSLDDIKMCKRMTLRRAEHQVFICGRDIKVCSATSALRRADMDTGRFRMQRG